MVGKPLRSICIASCLGLSCGLLATPLGKARADAIDTFKVAYYDVATSGFPSASGYGGAGSSGGAGENTVRIVNTAAANGTLCAMIYVFDDNEEIQECCGCPVTPDGLRTLSVLDDLTFNPWVGRSNLNAGVIEIVSSTTNWTPGSPPPAPNPNGTNGPSIGLSANGCSPTGAFSNDPTRATKVNPTPGLRAFITHTESVEPGNVVGGVAAQGASMDEFQDSLLDSAHLTSLQQRCFFLLVSGSGQGACTCGEGDLVSFPGAFRHRR
jgi:hypothetical protein